MQRFELSDGRSNKFWQIERTGSSVTVCYGKLGSAGQSKDKSFADAASARAHLDKLVAQKTRKGYVQVGKAGGQRTAPQQPGKAGPAKSKTDAVDQLALLRKASFCKSPDYGEVRFLRPGQAPALFDEPGELPVGIATWIAEEADGAAIGRLNLAGVRAALSPIVVIDNEGSLHLTGLCLVDHFGTFTSAAFDDDLEALHRFCRKADLPGPRKEAQVGQIAKKLKLSGAKLKRGKVPAVSEAALAELYSSAPRLEPKKKAPAKRTPRLGKASTPAAEYLGCCQGPDGAPWVVTPPARETKTCKSLLHRWDGSGFSLAGKLDGWVSGIHPFQGQLVYTKDEQLVFHNGREVTRKVPYRGAADAILCTAERLLIYDNDGALWQLSGKKMTLLLEDDVMRATPVLVDEDHLALFGGEDDEYNEKVRARLVDLNSGKAKRWPRPLSAFGGGTQATAGKHLLVVGYEELFTIDLVKGGWSKPRKTKASLGALTALSSGDVVGFVSNSEEIYVVSNRGGKLTVKQRGTLQLRRGTFNLRAIQTADDRLVVLGDVVETDRGKKPPALPEVIDLKSGKSSALPGQSKELAAQVKLQARR